MATRLAAKYAPPEHNPARAFAQSIYPKLLIEREKRGLRIWSYHVASGKTDSVLVHNRLYQAQDLARIQMADYVRSLASYLVGIYGDQAASVSVTVECDDVWLDVDAAIPCGLIVNELVSNALQHAFPPAGERVGGEIRVEVREEGDGQVSLTVSDDVSIPCSAQWASMNSPSVSLPISPHASSGMASAPSTGPNFAMSRRQLYGAPPVPRCSSRMLESVSSCGQRSQM